MAEPKAQSLAAQMVAMMVAMWVERTAVQKVDPKVES